MKVSPRVTPSSLCLLCALVASPPSGAGSIYTPSDPGSILIRGQSPTVHQTLPWGPGDLGQTSPWTTAAVPGTAQGPFYDDPFLEQPGTAPYTGSPGAGPYGTPPVYGRFGGRLGISGINGPQPFRLGWQPRFDVGYLPARSISPGGGKFGIFAFDSEVRNNTPLRNGSVFSLAPQFGLRTWDGPNLPGGGTLPGVVYRLGTDLEYSTTAAGPWSFTLGFNPSTNTDFARTPSSNAFNFDGRAMLFYRASPQWMYVVGIGYLDRVHNYILPYSGVVWTPNDRTELRLLFPESRFSHYIGNYFRDDKWVYVSAGFHVEAYQIEINRYGGNQKDQIELSDWRAVLGLRSENDYISSFIEGGIVFHREVDFLRSPGFDISNGFILRGGLRF